MRVTSREPSISRSELNRRCRLLAISVTSVLAVAACGGGGGGGGGSTPPPAQPPANTAPTVQAGSDQTIELPTNSANLSGSASDTQTPSLTYTWSATSGPAGVTFGTANSAATTVTFPSAGSYVLTLTASDGSLSGTDTVAVTVNAAMYPASDQANDTTDHGWTRVAAAADVGMDQALLEQAATYASTAGSTQPNSAGMIVRHGRLVHSWGDIETRFDLKSTTKSMGGIALGLAIDDSIIDVDEAAATYLPTVGARPAANASQFGGVLDQITVKQLATHTAGFDKWRGYEYEATPDLNDPEPTDPTLIHQPGTTWHYSDGGLNWLAETLTARFNQDLATVLSNEVWSVLGLNSSADVALTSSDVFWRSNSARPEGAVSTPRIRELASGIRANVNAMARVGLLFLRNGVWANDQRILSQQFIDLVKTPPPENAGLTISQAADYPGATTNYGMLWWTNATGMLANVPRDAYWAWGLGDSLIVVIPSLDIVVVRAGPEQLVNATGRVWNDGDWNGDYSVLAPFLDPIVQAVTDD